MKKAVILTFALALMLITVAHAELETQISEIKPNTSVGVWLSKEAKTNNSGVEQRILLGTNTQIFFCSLASNEFYRHGNSNRGGLSCKVSTEGANWYLTASGPSHEKNTNAGAAYAGCRAICLKSN